MLLGEGVGLSCVAPRKFLVMSLKWWFIGCTTSAKCRPFEQQGSPKNVE